MLEHLIEYYVYDFSEFLDIELSENGDFGFYSLDPYWNDQVNHSPFIVKLNDKIIGFVLVEKVEKHGEETNKIAEFFITKKYRRNGYGKIVAKQVFDMFRGSWEVTQIEKNIQKFSGVTSYPIIQIIHTKSVSMMESSIKHS